MLPAGFAGRLFGRLMERTNRSIYEAALAALDPQPGGRVLEIGFGTGAFAAMVAHRIGLGFLAGVDPSPLMVTMARSTMTSKPASVSVDLRQGDDTALDWPESSFDRIACNHAF